MADNFTHITGTEEGALKAGLTGIPPWATQYTLNVIKGILQKDSEIHKDSLKALQAMTKDIASGGTKKLEDSVDKLTNTLTRRNDEDVLAARRKRASDDYDAGMSRKQGTASKILSTTFGLLTAGSLKVLESHKQYVATSGELFKSGVNILDGNNDITSSMTALNAIVTDTGLRLETFQRVVDKYSSSVNAVGITKFAKSVKESSSSLIKMGYSSEQQAELIGSLIESQSSYADIRNQTDLQLSQSAVQLGGQLNKLSLSFGISNEKLQENLRATSKSTDSMVINATHGAEAANRFAVFASGIKDTNVRDMMTKLAAATTPELTQVFKDMTAAGMGDLAQDYARIARYARDMDPIAAQKQMESFTLGIDKSRIRYGKIQEEGGNQAATSSLNLLNAANQQYLSTSKATEGQVNAATDSQASISAFTTELEKFRATTQKLFPLLESTLAELTNGLHAANAITDGLAKSFTVAERAAVGAGLGLAGLAASSAVAMAALKGLSSAARGAVSGGAGGPSGNRRATKGALRGSVAGIVGGVALDYAGDKLKESGHEILGASADIASSALSFAGTGALLGTMFAPGPGTAIGATLGGIAGAGYGLYNNWGTITAPKQSEITSPSADVKTPEQDQSMPGPEPEKANTPIMDKISSESSINSIMAQQSAILTQILTGTNRIVSVNSDILRYTRNQ
jgi:hypothetical protein